MITKMMIAVLALASISAVGQTAEHAERIQLSKTGTKMSEADAANFWERVQAKTPNTKHGENLADSASASQAPGVVEVGSTFFDDEGYIHARFLSRRFPAGTYVCAGWKYTPSLSRQSLTGTPYCTGNILYPFSFSLEIFKGYLPDMSWTGNYQFDAFV